MLKLKRLIVLILSFFVLFASFNFSFAQDTISDETIADVVERLENCPNSIKAVYLTYDPKTDSFTFDRSKVSVEETSRGTLIMGINNGELIPISCANNSAIEKIVVRVIMTLFSIVGLVFFISFISNLPGLMKDGKEYEESVSGIRQMISRVILSFFAYSFITFVLVGVLGVGNRTGKSEYNLICQQRIVFSLVMSNDNLRCGEEAEAPKDTTPTDEPAPRTPIPGEVSG